MDRGLVPTRRQRGPAAAVAGWRYSLAGVIPQRVHLTTDLPVAAVPACRRP